MIQTKRIETLASLVSGLITVLALTAQTPPVTAAELAPIGEPIFDADIENPWGVAVSPDGMHVYVTSHWRDGALVALQRDIETGELILIQSIKDGREGADGLRWPYGITISQDGRFVYVASDGDDAVSVFQRNLTTGMLTFVEVEKGGVTWTGLDGCFDVALSPDGANLYAVGRWDNTLTTFSVDATSGELTLVEIHRDGVNGLTGLDHPLAVTPSPEGSQVFVSAQNGDRLFVFDRDGQSGRLTLADVWENGTRGLTILDAPREIEFSSNGDHVYVACYETGFVVLGRDLDTKQLHVIEEHQRGVAPDIDIRGLSFLTLSPDETRLYCSSQYSHTITVYRRDIISGKVGRAAGVWNLRGIRHLYWPHQITTSPDGRHAYVATGEDSLHCFDLRTDRGEISPHSVTHGAPSHVQGLREPTGLCVSRDGLNVYCPGAGNESLIVSFQREIDTGRLVPISQIGHGDDWQASHGLNYVEEVIVSPNNRDVYACAANDDAIAHLCRDAQDGHLIFNGACFNNSGVENMDYPHSIVLSPDNRHLYAAAYNSDSLVCFGVEEDGSLVFQESIVNGFGGLDRLDGPIKVECDPNGDHVYVLAAEDDALVIFSRDHATGILSYQGFVSDDLGGVDGLDNPRCLMVSPDGRHVYVACRDECSVACFNRNPASGRLTFIEATSLGLCRSGRSMVFNSAGTRLYVPFEGSDTLAVIERNPATGRLTLVETLSGNPPVGLDGMDGLLNVAISSDDRHLYVGSWNDDCIRAFALSPSE